MWSGSPVEVQIDTATAPQRDLVHRVQLDGTKYQLTSIPYVQGYLTRARSYITLRADQAVQNFADISSLACHTFELHRVISGFQSLLMAPS